MAVSILLAMTAVWTATGMSWEPTKCGAGVPPPGNVTFYVFDPDNAKNTKGSLWRVALPEEKWEAVVETMLYTVAAGVHSRYDGMIYAAVSASDVKCPRCWLRIHPVTGDVKVLGPLTDTANTTAQLTDLQGITAVTEISQANLLFTIQGKGLYHLDLDKMVGTLITTAESSLNSPSLFPVQGGIIAYSIGGGRKTLYKGLEKVNQTRFDFQTDVTNETVEINATCRFSVETAFVENVKTSLLLSRAYFTRDFLFAGRYDPTTVTITLTHSYAPTNRSIPIIVGGGCDLDVCPSKESATPTTITTTTTNKPPLVSLAGKTSCSYLLMACFLISVIIMW